MLATDLNPVNSSRIACAFLMSFGSFVVSDSLFDFLADVYHLGLVFSVHIFSSFDDGYELLVFAVDQVTRNDEEIEACKWMGDAFTAA